MDTAAIYARVSTKKQEKEGYSITEQLSFMREIAQRLGYDVPTEYQFHESASAFSEGLDREEFGKVRKLVQEGEIDAFIFFDRNRFTRDMGDGVILRREFYQNGVKLILAHPTPQEIKKEDELINIIEDWRSQRYVEEMTAKSMQGYAGKAKEGLYPNGRCPYGYRIEGEKRQVRLIVNEREKEIILSIFHWYTVESLGTIAIANRLTEMGIPTPGDEKGYTRKRAAGEWSQKVVRDILKNTAYVGVWYAKRQSRVSKHKVIIRPIEERIPVPTPTIVDPAVFASAQTRLAARDYTGRQKYHYLVSGRVKCTCGFAMHGCTASFAGRDKVYQYYKCNSSREASGQCGAPKFRQDAVDATVWRFTLELLRDPEKLLKGYQEAQQEQSAEQADLQRQIAQITAQIAEHNASLQETLEDKRKARSDSLKARLAEDAERIGELIDNLQRKQTAIVQRKEEEGITDEFIADTIEFMRAMRDELADIDETADYEAQHVIVSRLNLRITLRVTDGVKWVDIHWLRKVYSRVCEGTHKSL